MVHSKAFELSIVKLYNSSGKLTNVEVTSAIYFLVPDQEYPSEGDLPTTVKTIKRRKAMNASTSSDVNWFPATSNRLDRFCYYVNNFTLNIGENYFQKT